MQKRSSKRGNSPARSSSCSSLKVLALPERSKVQRNRRAGGGAFDDGEPSGSGKRGATSYFITSTTTLPSAVSKWFIGWNTYDAGAVTHFASATVPLRGMKAMCVPLSGSQANGGLPFIARSIEPVSGNTGSTIQFRVTAKSWIIDG